MATDKAEDNGNDGVSLVQKMLSAVTGSVLTSLLGLFSSQSSSIISSIRIFAIVAWTLRGSSWIASM